jgi:hypothetical protein
MTYDAMRAMCVQPDEHGNLICYAQKHNITNHTSIGMTQTGENVAALVELGWLVPQEKERWKKGRWANNRYIVLEHDEWVRAHHECPPFKYDVVTGQNLLPATDDRKDFPVNAALKGWARENRHFIAALSQVMNEATPEERKEWFREAKGEPVTWTLRKK